MLSIFLKHSKQMLKKKYFLKNVKKNVVKKNIQLVFAQFSVILFR